MVNVSAVELWSGGLSWTHNMEPGIRQPRQKTAFQRIRLGEAITDGRLYQTKMILADFTNVNYLDDKGLSPLMRAFMIEDAKHRTRTALIKFLIHYKADVNLRNRDGLHVLNWACKMNKLDLVNLLLEQCLQDVDLTSRDHAGNTPLIYAVINNNLPMVKLLVSALKKFSLSVDHRNKEDKTAYLKALEMGFDECASILSQVGKASRDIKVNPFLDFLAVPITGSSRKIRVHSAPLANEYGSIEKSKQLMINRRNKSVIEPLSDENFVHFSRNKKRRSRLFKSRKIHSTVSQKFQNENPKTVLQKTIKRDKKQSAEARSSEQNCKIFVENNALNSIPRYKGALDENKPKTTIITSAKESNSVSEKKEQLLRLLLDESKTQTNDAQQSPRSSVSDTSCSNVVTDQSRTIATTRPTSRQYYKPVVRTVSCNFTGKQPFRESNESRREDFPDYHSYLVWKASLDHPPNTLRSLLALRAEQHSQMSSYRKGIVIPRYEPTSEDSIFDRSVDATSPTSERSSKSEAGRKMSAVAKTVGLSIYLTNRRKNSYRKEP